MRILIGKNHPWAQSAAQQREPGAIIRSELAEAGALLQQAAVENADAVVLEAALQESSMPHPGEARTLVLCLHPLAEPLEVRSLVSTACAYLLTVASPDDGPSTPPSRWPRAWGP